VVLELLDKEAKAAAVTLIYKVRMVVVVEEKEELVAMLEETVKVVRL
jgi:hypothetical protein